MRHERHGNYYYCRHCEYFARKSNTLSMHITLKHTDDKPHKCPKCPKWFKTKSQRNHHVLSKHTESLLQCDYPGCEERFKNQANYRIHWIRKHDDIGRYMRRIDHEDWMCLTCEKIQPKNSLAYHVVTCSPFSPFSAEGKSLHGLVDLPDIDLFDDPEKPVSCLPGPTEKNHTFSALREGNGLKNMEDIDLPINVMDAMLQDEEDVDLDFLLDE